MSSQENTEGSDFYPATADSDARTQSQPDTSDPQSVAASAGTGAEEVRSEDDTPPGDSGGQSPSSQEAELTRGAAGASKKTFHSAEEPVAHRRQSPGVHPTASGVGLISPLDAQVKKAREDLLNQFYSTLHVMYLGAGPERAETREIHELIRSKLGDDESTWHQAYEIEQLLAFIIREDQLTTELPRRMVEAKALNLSFVDELEKQYKDAYDKLLKANEDEERKKIQLTLRCILHRLLNDLQWFYEQRIRRRDAAKRLSVRVSALFLSAFLFFFGLLFVQYFTNRPPVAQEMHKSPQPPAGANQPLPSTEGPHNQEAE